MKVFYSLTILPCRLISSNFNISRRFTLLKPKQILSRRSLSDLAHRGKMVVGTLHQTDRAGPSIDLRVDGNLFSHKNTCIAPNPSYYEVYRHLLSVLNTQPVMMTGKNRCYSTLSSGSDRKQNQCTSTLTYTYTRRKIQTKASKVTKKVEEKVKEWRENIMTVPNLLTTSRIFLSPVLGYLVLNEYYSLSCGLFVLTGITDMLDGYIARNFKNQQSVLGSILDPIADKLLVGILMISLSMQELIPVPLTALIISRDIALVLAGFYYRFTSLPPPFTLQRFFDVRHATIQMQPTFLGKLHTVVTLALVGFTLGAPVFNYVDHSYIQMLRYTTALTTIASGLSYILSKDTVKFLRKNK
ncbi:cardiolipin synthase (CMP-forming)-like [Anneissia japonica]|uniref:cardiolipin synthase (CMP-forming)-like n=1 Tax=Anneissia japonica TaxID=1529436 RepID=UPI0014259008|nr:cardiolipin synthase (CMP-forming)-like [Anneissia japonica]